MVAVKLPEAFVERMKRQLGEQFEAFIKSYERPRFYGLRLNPLKVDAASFAEQLPFSLRPVAWAEGAYYYEEPDRPGRHPYYHAGLYYIQEPSAMAPAELLGVQPGDRVLDLCAAPGGKSTQLAAKLRGDGLLVSNDQSAERTRALVKNLELFGVRNAVVLNESPHRLSRCLPEFFDKILVDAPCSGEGMFRKDEDMWREWSEASIAKCVTMQTDILRHAALMLRPGGTLVYSTCTFAPEENEQMMIRFMAENPAFETLVIAHSPGFAHGHHEGLGFDEQQAQSAARTVRLWPHLLDGEGHFVALLRKRERPGTGGAGPERVSSDSGRIASSPLRSARKSAAHARLGKKSPQQTNVRAADLEWMFQFLQTHCHVDWRRRRFAVYGDHVYMLTDDPPSLDGLKVVRPGFYMGILKKQRFEPSHALALALRPGDVRISLSLSVDDERLHRYLRCETLTVDAEQLTVAEGEQRPDVNGKYYVLVCAGPFALGWGKWQQGVLKNEYPQTWRRLS